MFLKNPDDPEVTWFTLYKCKAMNRNESSVSIGSELLRVKPPCVPLCDGGNQHFILEELAHDAPDSVLLWPFRTCTGRSFLKSIPYVEMLNYKDTEHGAFAKGVGPMGHCIRML